MKTIEYKIVFAIGSFADEIVRVQARNINTGFAKAVKAAREPLGNGREREIARVEFWAIP